MIEKKYVFVTQSCVAHKDFASVLAKQQIKYVALCLTYEERKVQTPYQKVIIVTTPTQAQNYKQLKKENNIVLYKPDFSHKQVEKHIRSICEQGWCDAILGLETNDKYDKLHKKYTYFTQVEAKLCKKNDIAILINQDSFLSRTHMLTFLTRISQLKALSQKFGLTLQVFSSAQNPFQIKRPQNLQNTLDVL